MWIEKGSGLNKVQLRQKLSERYADKARKLVKRNLTVFESVDYVLDRTVEHLAELNNALDKGNDVWLECTTANWRGNHWYQLYYAEVDAKGKARRVRFWAPLLMDSNSSKSELAWGFKSSVYGMSRQLDATDHVFALLKACGGTYTQLT